MHAMVLKKLGAALEWTEIVDRQPGQGQIRVKVTACGVCRTDLHVVDGELGEARARVAELEAELPPELKEVRAHEVTPS